jgi:putative ABC transport system permease protein
MDALWMQVRQAARSLRKSPGFTLLAAGGLALGIGATTAVFSAVKAVLIAPLPYPEPERILEVMESNPAAGLPSFGLALPNFTDYERRNSTFAAMTAYYPLGMALTAGDQPEQLTGVGVSRGYFATFGVEPLLGRGFLPQENLPGGPRVVIISHRLWQRLFGPRRGGLGRPLQLEGQPYTVVGVMPPGFKLLGAGAIEGDLWLPLTTDPWRERRSKHFLLGAGRLKPGVTPAQAQTDLNTIAAALAREYPDTNQGWGVVIDPFRERLVSAVRPGLLMLLATAGMLLLATCANVANLMLVRLAGKQNEIAVRSALGARRWQLTHQLLTESALLALAGGALGLAGGDWGIRALLRVYDAAIPLADGIHLDLWMVLFMVALSLFASGLVSLLPARRLRAMDLNPSLKEGGRSESGGGRSGRARRLLVAVEIALALVVLVGAGLLLRSYQLLLGVSPGFEPRYVATIQVVLPEKRYPEGGPETLDFFRRLAIELRAVPGVARAAAVSGLPLSDFTYTEVVMVEGQVPRSADDGTSVDSYAATPGYFATMKIPLLSGRDFRESDTADSAPVVIVSKAAARRFWPHQDPVGRRITFESLWNRPLGDPVRWLTVIGVAADVRGQQLSDLSGPVVYCPFLQSPVPTVAVVGRSAGDPAAIAGPLTRAIWRVDPKLPVFRSESLEHHVAQSLAGRRFNTLLLGIIGALTLCLAGLGVYGVVSQSVVQLRREVGIRMALGARRPQVLLWVIRFGMTPVLLGAAAGLLVALASSRLMASLLFGVGSADPVTIAAVTLTLGLTALLACAIPAYRATRAEVAAVLQEAGP